MSSSQGITELVGPVKDTIGIANVADTRVLDQLKLILNLARGKIVMFHLWWYVESLVSWSA